MVRCQGITLSGKQCKKYCKTDFCWVHIHETCGICLDDVCNYIKLDCGHKFCDICINEWICKSEISSCPTCRQEVGDEVRINSLHWGLNNFVIISAVHYKLNLSKFDINTQIHFMTTTEIVKYSSVNIETITEIRDKLDNETKLIWKDMWENVTFKKVLLLNNSRTKPEKTVMFFTFI